MNRTRYLTMAVLFAAAILNVRAAAIYKNLALNPSDVHDSKWTPANGFPHATSNSEYPAPQQQPPNPEYYALNAIDGKTANAIETQNPAWGPNTISNPWWRVAFGKPVQVDSMVIWIRADWATTAPIPHDSYWKSGTVVFSDSSKVNITIDSTAKPQGYKFPSRATTTLTITNLVQHTPGWRGWCALAEVQVWGFDAPASAISVSPQRVSLAGGSGSVFLLPGSSSRSIALPEHASGMEVFTTEGRKVWSSVVNAGKSSVSVPSNLGKGVYAIRYVKDSELPWQAFDKR